MGKFYYQVDIVRSNEIQPEQRDELLISLASGCKGVNLYASYSGKEKKYNGGFIFPNLYGALYFKITSVRDGLASEAEIKMLADFSAKTIPFLDREKSLLEINDISSLLKEKSKGRLL